MSAIGVNYADCVIRMGLYESARQYVGWPITPGFLSYLFSERAILAEAMTQLLGGWREGHLQLPRITTYPFARVADAHRDLQSGQTVGKLVLLTAKG